MTGSAAFLYAAAWSALALAVCLFWIAVYELLHHCRRSDRR